MPGLLSRALCCRPGIRRHNELSEQEILAIKESWAKASQWEVGQKILSSLIDKRPKFAEIYGIECTLDVNELQKNSIFIVQARRIQNFLDTVVASLGLCPDEAVHSMAHRVGQIHYYKGVNFGADNWLVFKKVAVDQIIASQKFRKQSSVSTLETSVEGFTREVLYLTNIGNDEHLKEGAVLVLMKSSVDALSAATIRCCMATVGWNKLMSILIREMKRESEPSLTFRPFMGILPCRSRAKVGKDPDEIWSNLYREKEKNNMYRWVGKRNGGDLLTIYETSGEEGVLRFAEEKFKPLLFEDGPHEIKLSDYVKYRKQMDMELGINSEDQENLESLFKNHTAQWRLNKRGIDGENVIHLLLSRDDVICHEIARILLKRYPGLSGDTYLGSEMFGQTALHQAIVHDDYETAQLLLQNGADVNARARGNFFMPEHFKSARKADDYSGWAYYGEYPLAFAACFGNKDIYDLLIDHGADPNLRDAFGNTILHMCVIHNSIGMYSYAVQHWKKEADTGLTNNAGYTPLTLATKLGRKKIFDQMLELSKVEFWRFSDMTCSAYPLTALDTIRQDGSTNYDSALMTVINGNTPEHYDMIGSEVIQRLLADKWSAFAKVGLYKRMATLVVQLIAVSLAAGLRPTELDRLYFGIGEKITADQQQSFLSQNDRKFGPGTDDWFRLSFEIITYALSLMYFYQQFTEVRAQGVASYARNMSTTPAKLVYTLANIFILLCLPCRVLKWAEIEEGLLSLAVPGSFIYLLFFCRSFKLTGPFVQMIYSMIAGDLILFATIAVIFIVPFTFIMYLYGGNIEDKQRLDSRNEADYCPVIGYTIFSYNSRFETFVTLFRAALGGYDYEELQCANYELIMKLLFMLYMLIMPVMMINILIAMMGNTYNLIIEEAEKAWRRQYALIVMNLERSLDPQQLVDHLMNYSIRLNDGADADARGLMVVKKTNNTRANTRRRAVLNWQLIGKKVIHYVSRLGVEQAVRLLHGHDRLDGIFDDVRDRRPPTRNHWPLVWKHGNTEIFRMEGDETDDHSVVELAPPESSPYLVSSHKHNVAHIITPDEMERQPTAPRVPPRPAPPTAPHLLSRTVRVREVILKPAELPNMPQMEDPFNKNPRALQSRTA